MQHRVGRRPARPARRARLHGHQARGGGGRRVAVDDLRRPRHPRLLPVPAVRAHADGHRRRAAGRQARAGRDDPRARAGRRRGRRGDPRGAAPDPPPPRGRDLHGPPRRRPRALAARNAPVAGISSGCRRTQFARVPSGLGTVPTRRSLAWSRASTSGFHTGQGRYDQTAERLRYVLVCDACEAEVRELETLEYRAAVHAARTCPKPRRVPPMDTGVAMFPTHDAIGPGRARRAGRGARARRRCGSRSTRTSRRAARRRTPAAASCRARYAHTLDLFVAMTAAAVATRGCGSAAASACHRARPDRHRQGGREHRPPLRRARRVRRRRGLEPRGDGQPRHRPEAPLRRHARARRGDEGDLDPGEASYHGEHVDFDRIWSWPKPAQHPHPPVMIGGNGDEGDRPRAALRRRLDAPAPPRQRGRSGSRELRRRAAEAGRAAATSRSTIFGVPAPRRPRARSRRVRLQRRGAWRCRPRRAPGVPARKRSHAPRGAARRSRDALERLRAPRSRCRPPRSTATRRPKGPVLAVDVQRWSGWTA